MNFNVDEKLLHGGDYNPDQWLDYPDIIDQDFALMKKAHINTITLGVFAWSALEPEEGHFDFSWMDDIFARMNQLGGNVILATPSGARPQWLSEKYPEVNRVDERLQRHTHGFRHDHCYSSPVYRAKVKLINTKLAERYGQNPALAMWHVSNEYSGECFCDLCEANWQRWLQAKYHTLKALNDAWLTSFWGGTYSSWHQIKVPSQLASTKIHGMALDWRRFNTAITIDFFDAEVAPLRAANAAVPVTTNFMAEGPGHDFIPLQGLDYGAFAKHVDLVSWDSYPQWNNDYEPLAETAMKTAFVHDTFYGLKEQPFLVMESAPSRVNTPVAKLKRPGVHALASFQQIAHGSEGSLYFQIRAARANSEKFHGAVIGHDGSDDTRVFKEVAAYGARLSALAGLRKAKRQAKVGIVYDWDVLWAQHREAAFGRDRKRYFQTLEDHYAYFWQHDIPVTLVPVDHDFRQYDLVIAPMLYLMRPELMTRLRAYVSQGGTLVATYFTGIVDEHDSVYLGGWPAPLQETFGIKLGEFDSVYPDEHNHVDFAGQQFETHDYNQLIEPVDAEVLGRYQDDFYAGSPAITRHRFGQGTAYYIGPRTKRDLLNVLYASLPVVQAELARLVAKPNPAVSIQSRVGQGERTYFIMNFSSCPQTISLARPLIDCESHGPLLGQLVLTPYRVVIAKERA
ncbi:beta-galactosidase [Lacticaseibacillus jixianensis]|uniref:Beta-galactosidase n=1 Tax=Lacticaseibacillus jixianensis TaxID=2486012 RepID=A0ABW4BA80_9LACO|nr:beta-galactosidase [Lacticaseibacillus jixianensis]